MTHRTRMLLMSAVWLAFGGYAWYLLSKHGGRAYFACVVVGVGMALANLMRALLSQRENG